MGISFFIALRYLFSKKSKNIINVISFISLLGIAVSTASMVIVLSAFNGIENFVVDMYSDFDQDITISFHKGKTINQQFFPIQKIEKIKGIQNISRVIEEVVIVKNNDKWVHAKIFGVDSIFLNMSSMQENIMDNEQARLHNGKKQLAILGAGLFDKLELYLSHNMEGYDFVSIHAPNRKAKSSRTENSFKKKDIGVSSRFNFNKEINDKIIVVPIDFAQKLLNYDNDISFLALQFKKGINLEEKQREIENLLGTDFNVKTRFQKNEIIYKTNKIERILAIIILSFIFLLATFNMIASLSMLFLEKEKDLITLKSMGLYKKDAFKIFFYEGIFINILGMIVGFIIGVFICFLQIKFQIILINEITKEAFPIIFKAKDFVLILCLIFILGGILCWIPTKVLFKKSKVF